MWRAPAISVIEIGCSRVRALFVKERAKLGFRHLFQRRARQLVDDPQFMRPLEIRQSLATCGRDALNQPDVVAIDRDDERDRRLVQRRMRLADDRYPEFLNKPSTSGLRISEKSFCDTPQREW